MGLSVDPNDILLTPQRLNLATMKVHHFVTANSCAGSLVYRMLFTDGDEREVPLAQPSLFSICRMPWPRSKEELDEQVGLLGFHRQHDSESQEVEAPSGLLRHALHRGVLEFISGQRYFFVIFWRCHLLALLGLIST
jgi:hypothetical protein